MSLPNMPMPINNISEESERALNNQSAKCDTEENSECATIEVDCQIAYQSGLARSASQRRLIIPLTPVSPMSSDSPPSDSDEDECSPTIKFLDPAHRPSPRALHALRQQHPPLNVINNESHDEPWSRRHLSRGYATPGNYR